MISALLLLLEIPVISIGFVVESKGKGLLLLKIPVFSIAFVVGSKGKGKGLLLLIIPVISIGLVVGSRLVGRHVIRRWMMIRFRRTMTEHKRKERR